MSNEQLSEQVTPEISNKEIVTLLASDFPESNEQRVNFNE